MTIHTVSTGAPSSLPRGDRALVVLSGGQDSTTCLFWAKQKFAEVHAITFDYNQRHASELASANRVAQIAGVKTHTLVSLGGVLRSTSPLVSDAQLEQYKDHASLPGGLEKTFVPMRNQLFLTIAANHAAALDAAYIITGVCEEDYGGYPDCRAVFVKALERAICLSLGAEHYADRPSPGGIKLLTPLMHLTKRQTVELALDLPGCYPALAWTHTAYDGAYPPVGHDHASLLRAKGFEEAGYPDPLVLRAVLENKMARPDAPNYTAVAERQRPLTFQVDRRFVELEVVEVTE